MRTLFYIFVAILIMSCAVEDPTACFENGGSQITKAITLDSFARVIVREGISLEVVSGTSNRVTIEHSENYMDDISTKIVDGRLIIENSNACKFFKGYKPAKILLEALDLAEIRNASQYTVSSRDTLKFDSLKLISEDFDEKEVNVGDFNLVVSNQTLSIVTNNTSNFFISGNTQNFNINFASGQGKLESENLAAQNIFVFHRGTNDLWVHPIQEIKGEIRGTGNVIAAHRPAIIEVDEYYTGRLIFRD